MHTSMRRARTIVATCAVPVSVQWANAQLPLFEGDLLSESTAFIMVNLVLSKVGGRILVNSAHAGI